MKEMRWSATIVDISQGGMRIVLPRRFEKGTGLAIELPGDEKRESTVVFVKVVHLKAEGGGWALGCKFVSELGDDEMQRLLTSKNYVLSSSKEEKQQDEAEEPESDDEPVTEALPDRVEFISNVFLCLSTPGDDIHCVIRRLNVTRSWPLTPGKILNLRGKEKDPWSLRVQVARCEDRSGEWEIHGRVIGPAPSSDMLKALGS